MAIIKCGALVVGIRGTIGGVTYAQNHHGPYARIWSRSANRRTPTQSSSRVALAWHATSWRLISPANRADWDTWAAQPEQAKTNPLGETYYISGFLWWVALSRNLQLCARPRIESAPTLAKPTAPDILSLRVSHGALSSQITYLTDTFDPDYDCVLHIALGYSIGATALPTPTSCLPGYQTPAAEALDITAELAATFGTINVGQKAFALIYRQNMEGYRSAPTAINVDVVA